MQELNYIRCGDYYIPDILLPEETRAIGRLDITVRRSRQSGVAIPDWLEPTAGLGGSRQRNIQQE